MLNRTLTTTVRILAICLLACGFTVAQDQGETPEVEPTPQTEEKPETEEEEAAEKRARLLEQALKEGPTESVKVTATRVETDLMKTPVAVTVIDQETLDREGVQSVAEMAQMVPNMDIAINNGQSTPVISLRGVRSTNETELGDPSVGVHLDGIYSPRMQGILALMFDNERVEVLRGPQGTLFGRNSTVGSINIVTAKPKLDAVEARVNVQYGNFNAPELQLMYNRPVNETFALRFAGRVNRADSYLDGYWDPNQFDQRYIADLVGGANVIEPWTADWNDVADCDDPGCFTESQKANFWAPEQIESLYGLVPADDDDFYMNSREWAYRVSGLWQPKNRDMSLNVGFQHYRNNGAGGVDLVNCDKLRGRPSYRPQTQINDMGQEEFVFDDQGNQVFEVNPDNPTDDCGDRFPTDDTYQAVVSTPGELYLDIMYLRTRFDWDLRDNLRFVASFGLEDQDRESAQDMEQSLNAWDQAFFFLPGTGSQSWSQELQLQSQTNTHFNWIAGANYFHEKTSTLGYFDNSISPKSLFNQPDRSTNAWAVFAQGTYSYSPKWHLTIGARFSDETKEDKGGETWECSADNGCAPFLNRVNIAPAGSDPQLAFDRDQLNAEVPVGFFGDPSNYPEGAVTGNDNKGSWNHTDVRVGLDYQRNDDQLYYAYLATGFKSGGIGDVFVLRDTRPPSLIPPGEEIDPIVRTDYDPEEVTTLELGFKTWHFDRKLGLRGAYFFSDYEDMQYASPGAIGFNIERGIVTDDFGNDIYTIGGCNPEDATCVPCTQGDPGCFPFRDFIGVPVIGYFTQNVPGAKIQGFELEYDWRPWTGGRINGYASWLDTEINDDWITKWNYDARSYFNLNFADAADPTNERLLVNMRGNDLAVSPPFKIHMTIDHAFFFEKKQLTIVPWLTAHWEDDSYLTIWNVDRHTDDLDFVINDQDIRFTDDKREAWSMFHAGVRLYSGNWMAEAYGYNLTDEVVQWWGAADNRVPKGSFSVPFNYGFRVGYTF